MGARSDDSRLERFGGRECRGGCVRDARPKGRGGAGRGGGGWPGRRPGAAAAGRRGQGSYRCLGRAQPGLASQRQTRRGQSRTSGATGYEGEKRQKGWTPGSPASRTLVPFVPLV